MMNFTEVSNPRYANSKKTAITCDVLFLGFNVSIPFTATCDDVEQHGRDIFNQCKLGVFGEVSPYEYPGREYFQNIAKSIRDEYLAYSNDVTGDWRIELQLGIINNYDREMLMAWMRYNKELKNMIFNDICSEDSIKAIVWPVQPVHN